MERVERTMMFALADVLWSDILNTPAPKVTVPLPRYFFAFA